MPQFHKRSFNSYDPQTRSDNDSSKKSRSASIDNRLPICKSRRRILKEIEKSDTIIIVGETGCGKTTQIPQFLYGAGYAKHGIIAITQPRRVAAITIARRVADEMLSEIGKLVGYTVRFEDCSTELTRIRFLTDGYLLREVLSDSLLRKYSVIMLDEVHERTVNTDVLLGIVKNAQRLRRLRNMQPLKIIISSATMDVEGLSKYFNVQGLYVEGRTHPIRVFHTKEPQKDGSNVNGALITLFQIHRELHINHDVLIFLTGQEEIESVAYHINQISKVANNETKGMHVCPMYAQLPHKKQLECFLPAPAQTRKVILATNIAETSITIPGIRCIIDAGFVKQKSFQVSTGLETLKSVRISQAQAWQRSGRAGRESAGTCYRLYTQEEMKKFEVTTKPEILRSNLSDTVLQMLALRIDCKKFDFLDAPPIDSIEGAYLLLESLGAIKCESILEISELGRQMVQYPLDPKYSKILLSAPKFGCMAEMLSLIAVLSCENVFVQSADNAEYAKLAHLKFQSKRSDHLTLLNVFNAFQESDRKKTWCYENFMNWRNLCFAARVRDQLLQIAERQNLNINSCGENLDLVKECLLAGLFNNVATLQLDGSYITDVGKQRVQIHPSSGLADIGRPNSENKSKNYNSGKTKPQHLLYTEIVQTERIYIRQVSEISPEWIPKSVAKYLNCKR